MNSILRKITYRKMPKLFTDFDTQHVQYAIIKGEPLSFLAYGCFSNRNAADFDILTSDISTSKRIIFENGFSLNNSGDFNARQKNVFCVSSSHQLAPFADATGNVIIDLNFDIFWGEYEGKRVDIEEFLSDTVEMEIYGVKVKTLPPLKAMVQLVLHHYKDMNSLFLLATRNSIRYEMFKDVYYLLKNNPEEISLEKLYAISSEYEIVPYVFYVLYYTGRIFDDDVLKIYIEAFRTPEGERLLNLYGLCEKERKEWKVDFRTRLESENLLPLIEADLTERDRKKIELNKKVFMGG